MELKKAGGNFFGQFQFFIFAAGFAHTSHQSVKQRIHTYTKWFLPLLFVAYYGIVTLFVHVHIEEGTTIVHSHPFHQTADGTCHHHASASEIQLFHVLSTITVSDGAVHPLQLHFFATPLATVIDPQVYPDHLIAVTGPYLLRAPPVC